MRNEFTARFMAVAAAVVMLPLTPASAAGQSKAAKASFTSSKPAPRMPDGKPDLSGFWQGPLLRSMFASVGGPPLTLAGEAAHKYNMTQPVNPARQHQRGTV